MNKDQLQKYDPKNAINLSEEDIKAMVNFSDDDLHTLGEMFPNKATGNAYLVLGNSKAKIQIGSRGTFQNLYNLRVSNKRKEFYALSYVNIWKKAAPVQSVGKLADLTKAEVKQLTGKAGVGKAIKALKQMGNVQQPKPNTIPDNLQDETQDENIDTEFSNVDDLAAKHNEETQGSTEENNVTSSGKTKGSNKKK
jgi:hypothetical protein